MDTAALLKEIRDQLKKYSKENFGALNGPDFPELATTLINLDSFTFDELLLFTFQSAAAESLLPKLIAAQASPDSKTIRAAFRGSVTETMLLDMFYWGYCFGKRTAEIEDLKQMADKS